MKLVSNILVVCLFLFAVGCGTQKPPNVLFIAIDDLNDSIDMLDGNLSVKTPAMDELASRGTLFTNAHCSSPACNPSRTSLLTGVRASSSGVYENMQNWRECTNLEGKPTLPEYFKSQGYKTIGGGKLFHAHSFTRKALSGFPHPEAWDEYYPSKDQQMPAEVWPENWPVNSFKKLYGGHFDWGAMDIDDAEMGDAKVVAWAEKQLSQQHDGPVFMTVGIYRPHVPWYVPNKYFDMHPLEETALPTVMEGDLDDVPPVGQKFARVSWQKWMVDNGKWREAVQSYRASVSFADEMVRRVIEALDNGPLAENTIVVLWSDHGYHLGVKQHWEKFALWEQTTRVPIIIATPDGIGAGSRTSRPVSLLDLYPTLMDLCGLPAPAHLEGQSLTPLLADPEALPGRVAVMTHIFNNHAVRSDRWRYIRYADGSEELYDHDNDQYEWHNLAGQPKYADVINEHKRWLPKDNAEHNPPVKRRGN
jgi:arylsulfatase A-like enzyme